MNRCKLLLSVLCLSLSGLFVVGTEATLAAPLLPENGCCADVIGHAAHAESGGIAVANEITLVSWNIAKGHTDGWLDDLREFAQGAQLVLLQEAVLVDEMKQPRTEPIHWSFSPGYRTDKFRSGIMTLSRAAPATISSLTAQEPWIRSPKVTNITEYQYAPDRAPLLVVNMHAINFTFGTGAYTAQLQAISEVLEQHPGPIIFSGDLNSWSGPRTHALEAMTQKLGLSAVTFVPDHRIRRFGRALDHVFVRGLNVKSSRTVEVETSDHNPLIMTLVVADT